MQGRAAVEVGGGADDDRREGAHLADDIGALDRQFAGVDGEIDGVMDEVEGGLLVHQVDGEALVALGAGRGCGARSRRGRRRADN